MTGVSAGRNIVVAGHSAQIIEGAYVNVYQNTININFPPGNDPEQLKQLADILGLSPRPPGPDVQHHAGFEAQLNSAAQLLLAVPQDRVLRKHVHIPHDLAGLRVLQKEIDARFASITTERLKDLSWLADVPAHQTQLAGYRLQRGMDGLTPAHVPPIPTRFSPGDFVAYYAARDVTAALFEATQFRVLPVGLRDDYVFVGIKAKVERLLDLSDPDTRKFIDDCSPGFYRAVVARDLTWPRELGAWLVHAGFGGCIFPSANSIGRDNIVLFPDNLSSNAIEIRQVERYRPA